MQITVEIWGETPLLDGGVSITLDADNRTLTINQTRLLTLALQRHEGWLRERWEEDARTGQLNPWSFVLDLETGEIS
jgi:hypothetical protein